MTLSKRTQQRLVNYPTLRKVIKRFIKDNGYLSNSLTDLTIYIRCLDIDEPSVFQWSYHIRDEFYSWGHNSRYANVLEPMLCGNLNLHICRLLNYMEAYEIAEPEL